LYGTTLSALTLKAGREFAGVVIEAVSGDCLVIADASSGMERRVNLASIRAPRIGNERRGQKPEAWATEAKEFLRQRAVGHSVEVVMEYSRKIGGGGGGGGGVDVTATDAAAPERHLDFGTVSLASDGANLAEMLVMRGFASAIKHRGDDERSGRYDDILAAEQRAIKGKKGVQNRDREAPIHRVNDASATAAKAKQFLPFLQRAGKSAGVVEYVVTGHRMKIHVPKESASIAFSLAGVRCPQPPRSGSGGEPHGADALRFVRHACLQRDVEIEVDAVDKTGTFLGHLTTQGGRFNLSEELLKRGLGTLHPSFTPERHPSGESLVRAQEQAKQIRAGVWVGWSPEAEAAAAAAA
jgi:staphylococcal nuclease domain-containing protein 1